MSEVTIAGNLIDMFRPLTPANDLEFRYGTNAPTRAAGGHDRCRAVTAQHCGRLLEAVMREAGELARATARGPFKRWTKGDDNSPVSEGDIAVNDLLRARLPALVPGAGWLSEETEALPDARSAARLGGGSDRRHPRLYRRARRLDHFGGAGGKLPGRCWPRSTRR